MSCSSLRSRMLRFCWELWQIPGWHATSLLFPIKKNSNLKEYIRALSFDWNSRARNWLRGCVMAWYDFSRVRAVRTKSLLPLKSRARLTHFSNEVHMHHLPVISQHLFIHLDWFHCWLKSLFYPQSSSSSSGVWYHEFWGHCAEDGMKNRHFTNVFFIALQQWYY